jgi:hypothetical protein
MSARRFAPNQSVIVCSTPSRISRKRVRAADFMVRFRSVSIWCGCPKPVHTAADLLLRSQPETGMIRRWRYS